MHTHSREEDRKNLNQDGGWPQGKQLLGHTGSDPEKQRHKGARGNQVQAGTKHQCWSRKGVTAENLRVRDDLGQPSGTRDPQRDRPLGRFSVYTKQKWNSAEMRIGLWERKSCKGNISVLWLLFEAVLAAPKQTVGLGKNTPQTGRKAVEKFSWRLPLTTTQLFPSGLSPWRKSRDRPRESSAAGKGRGVCGRWGSRDSGVGLTSV